MDQALIDDDLFRTVSSRRVLSGFGAVFRDPHEYDSGYERVGAADGAADALYALSDKSARADAFISHSWSDHPTLKWLALSYYANMNRAVAASLVTCLALLAVLLVHSRGDVLAYGGAWWLLPIFLSAPLVAFVLALGGGGRRRWWLDKLCVHQRDASLRAAGIRKLPNHLARSNRLVVLHSEAYFSRLWTSFEVATFLAARRADCVDVVPLWLPPLVLAAMASDIVGSALFMPVANRVTPALVARLGPFGMLLAMLIAFPMAYFFAIGPVVLAARARIRARREARDQIRDFRLTRAACSDERDRPLIEARVAALYVHRDDPVGAFEEAVRGLGEFARPSGSATSFREAALPMLPFAWSTIANVLNCDGSSCDRGAEALGFDETTGFMIAHALAGLSALLCSFTLYPLIWRLIARDRRGQLRYASCSRASKRPVFGVRTGRGRGPSPDASAPHRVRRRRGDRV